jgi:hypothetical protein
MALEGGLYCEAYHLLTRYFPKLYHEINERNLLCFYEKQASQAKGDHFWSTLSSSLFCKTKGEYQFS